MSVLTIKYLSEDCNHIVDNVNNNDSNKPTVSNTP